jgi:glutamate/tyrosine decarboxylase-like PLP-dependent enzyme
MGMIQIALPNKGASRDGVMRELKALHSADNDWRTGRMFSLIYNAGADVESVAREAYAEYMVENALSPFSLDRKSVV